MFVKVVRHIACWLLPVVMMGCDGDGTVIVEAHVVPDDNCGLDLESAILTQGVYDIFKAGQRDPMAGVNKEDLPANHCSNGYDLNLRVKNLSDESIVFDAASVRIEDATGRTIVFDRDRVGLPNPFETRAAAPLAGSATGIVTVQVIPVAYGAQLDGFRNEEIVARVELLGTTESGDAAASRPFRFPIQLCWGCLYSCLNADVLDLGGVPEDLYGDQCADDAGADDRMCLDPNC